MPFTRWIPIAALSLLLASCFVSEKPLIAETDADYPIADGARFSEQILKADGTPENETPQEITITRVGAYYLYTAKGDEPMKGLLDDLGNGDYVGMTQGETGLLYGLYQKRGEKWLRHGLVCSDFEKLVIAQAKTLADFGITKKDSDCAFSNYADLKRALAFEAEHGRPDAEYTPVK
jgi:hypothetical protein